CPKQIPLSVIANLNRVYMGAKMNGKYAQSFFNYTLWGRPLAAPSAYNYFGTVDPTTQSKLIQGNAQSQFATNLGRPIGLYPFVTRQNGQHQPW
ncbi:MAG: hypothetical protein RL712_765, partial [Bacteroidota bacterium]